MIKREKCSENWYPTSKSSLLSFYFDGYLHVSLLDVSPQITKRWHRCGCLCHLSSDLANLVSCPEQSWSLAQVESYLTASRIGKVWICQGITKLIPCTYDHISRPLVNSNWLHVSQGSSDYTDANMRMITTNEWGLIKRVLFPFILNKALRVFVCLLTA